MSTKITADQLMDMFGDMMVALVRENLTELTMTQLTVLLTCYLVAGPHTVGGLAGHLRSPATSVTRMLDRLGALGLIRRKKDPLDSRRVLAQTTRDGMRFVRKMRAAVDGAAAATAAGTSFSGGPAPKPRRRNPATSV